MSLVESNEFGRYRGNSAGRIANSFNSEQKRLLHHPQAGLSLIRRFAEFFAKACQSKKIPLNELGIDAYFHLDAQGKVMLRPFSELNPRLTMGALALAWHKR